MRGMRVDLRRWRDLSQEERRRCDVLELAVHGPPKERRTRPAGQLVWAPIDPEADHVVLVWEGDDLVSSVLIGMRDVVIDGRRTRVACIRGMRTDPAHRRRGFGKAAMERAAEFIWNELRPEMGMLLSSEMAVPLYQGLGWKIVTGPVYCDQPTGRINYSERLPNAPAMVLLPEDGEAPTGPIDLCGLPF